jgi:hypothetical protein
MTPTVGARRSRGQGDNHILVPGLVPLVDKETGEIEYVVAHDPEIRDRLHAMTPVSG